MLCSTGSPSRVAGEYRQREMAWSAAFSNASPPLEFSIIGSATPPSGVMM